MNSEDVYHIWEQKINELILNNLPYEHSLQKTKAERHTLELEISDDIAQLKKHFVLNNQDSLFALFLSVFKILLYRYTAQPDGVVMIPVSADNAMPNKAVNNILPVRTSVQGSASILDLLEDVLLEITELRKYHQFDISNLSDEARQENNVIHQILFTLDPYSDFADKSGNGLMPTYNSERFDLHFSIKESGQGLKLAINYAANLFSATTVSCMLANYKELLSNIIDQQGVQIDLLRILTSHERARLLLEFNDTQKELNKKKSVTDIFEEQVRRTPENIALIYGATRYTYEQLNTHCNQLARFLVQKGVKFGTYVPICLGRSAEMIISILAVLKAGGTYVPIDPEYPSDRVAYMLENLKARIVVCDDLSQQLVPRTLNIDIVNLISERNIISTFLSTNLKVTYKPQNLAYVIFTSGSTGQPKGAGVFHRNMGNLLQWYLKEFAISNLDTMIIISSFAFDLTQKNIFSTLMAGGKLIIPEMVHFDSQLVINTINENKVTIINCAPNAFYPLIEDNDSLESINTLRLVVLGGEPIQMNRLERWISTPNFCCEIVNSYGPTECTDIASFYRISQPLSFINKSIPIGRPNDNVKIFILSQSAQLQPINAIGEIYIGGAGVGAGYLENKELTDSKFITSLDEYGQILYKTGDMGRWLPDGNIEYLGRVDHQVKINGNRIELEEIEILFQTYPGIKQAVVIVKEEQNNSKRLIGYYVTEHHVDQTKLSLFLKSKLPKYMVPTILIRLDKIPLTANSKVDRKMLIEKNDSSPKLSVYQQQSELVGDIVDLWKESLSVETIGNQDNFFELGGNSLLASNFVSKLKRKYGYELPVIKLYQYPTIDKLANFLAGKKEREFIETKKGELVSGKRDVAVIGMAGRFPGAETVEDLWEIIKAGKETITFFPDEEIDCSIPVNVRDDPDYIKARGIIPDAQNFDASFFGLNVKLAQVMDPQHRIFLEIAWEVLEKTGYLPQRYMGEIGVYAGCGNNTYYLNNVLKNQPILNQVGEFRAMTVNEKDYISSRTAYQLNLKGPAVSVYSACSTSLLAVTQAVDAIRNGHCDIAIAGGVSITAPINSGHLYQEGSMMSGDGHCRPFDASAKGTVFSDGAGVVLLKDLETAKNDGDQIFATIKGIGLNNDGSDKGSFTSPNAIGQALAIKKAIVDAHVDPHNIQYIEAHGTATPIGDPIEIEGLKMAFGDQMNKQFCAIGSIKSNMGHLTAAAGIAGLIKTALALYYKKLPPSIGFEKPNVAIDFANSPFYVNTTFKEWESEHIRHAGVSSFGIGGTNVHVILEEFVEDRALPAYSRPFNLVTWSAKSGTSNEMYAAKLANFLTKNSTSVLPDIAYTLQQTRVDFNSRSFLVVNDLTDLRKKLMDTQYHKRNDLLNEVPLQMIFVFPGQGTQYLNMGKDLYEQELVYRKAVDECADYLDEFLKIDIRSIIFPLNTTPTALDQLNNTRYTQSALFVTEYALAKLWTSWGIKPAVLCGHSLGEFVAGHFAGIFSLSDALKLVAIRGLMVSELPSGGMIAARMHADEASGIIFGSLSVAAINGDNLCVIAGQSEDIAVFAELLENKAIAFKILDVDHAFHSSMMDPVVKGYKEVVKSIDLKNPRIPIISSVTGTWMTNEEATDPEYWASHLRQTVLFSKATDTMLDIADGVFLEIGPGNTLCGFIKQKGHMDKALTSLPAATKLQTDHQCLLESLGWLWSKGLNPDWNAFYEGQNRKKIDLPTYAFDKIPCWVNPMDNRKDIEMADKLIPLTEPSTRLEMDDYISEKKKILTKKVTQIVVNTSGLEIDDSIFENSFFEIGLDSLLLTQLSIALKNHFKIPITFRQLNGELSTTASLLGYLLDHLPESYYELDRSTKIENNNIHPSTVNALVADVAVNETVLGLIAQQLTLLTKQVGVLQGKSDFIEKLTTSQTNDGMKSGMIAEGDGNAELEFKKPFGAMPRIDRQVVDLTKNQRDFITQLAFNYNSKTNKSKNYSQNNREHMADPRVVSGFKPLTKELIYPLVVNKSKGSKLWDIDGNEYIDVLNGFGSNFLGYQPEFIKTALHNQVEQGFEVGPQHELAGKVCKLVCEFTDFDRAALCNTGSEAVLGAMRIARTITGRSLIVAFSDSYHGIMDEVLVRRSKNSKTLPAAPGIMLEAVQNMLILDYGTEESLKVIQEKAGELAAVLVEPVQSRRPEYQPVDFLKQVRNITSESGTALIFDEVITGFRMHPGGAQALFDIKADIASYGKVIGGGLPIGVIAGKKHFMDALDGGFWNFGDDSIPEVGVTYFAGTFVRHPLALASTNASLQYMKDAGPGLQKGVNQKAEKLAIALNQGFESRGVPIYVAYFGSLWKIKFKAEIPYSELLFTLMRCKGIHIWDGFPCFMTDTHSVEEIESIMEICLASLDEMIEAGFFGETSQSTASEYGKSGFDKLKKPPVPHAKLGRDKQGNPGWFVVDPNAPGKFFKVDIE